tara:strand:- start:583 stop:1170 length:588 start_codon:yes stop_codon:yes gene_type:complete
MWNPEEKFVFIHPQKCAGTSLRTILRDKYTNGKCKLKYEPRGSGHWRAKQWAEHIKNTTGEDISDYFVFGVVRNPWDRAVSYYHHLQVHKEYKRPFWYFILNESRYISCINYSIYTKFTIDNKYIIDYIVKQETFKHDLGALMERLSIKNYNISHDNHKTNREEYDYRKYYDNTDLIDQVYNVSQFEINKFNYNF